MVVSLIILAIAIWSVNILIRDRGIVCSNPNQVDPKLGDNNHNSGEDEISTSFKGNTEPDNSNEDATTIRDTTDARNSCQDKSDSVAGTASPQPTCTRDAGPDKPVLETRLDARGNTGSREGNNKEPDFSQKLLAN